MPINVIKSPSLCQRRDLRSTSVPYKREKDHSEKLSNHSRPGSSHLRPSGGESEESMTRRTADVQNKSLSSKPRNTNTKTNKMAKVSNKVNGRPNNRNNVNIDETDSFIPKLPYTNSLKTSRKDDQEHNIDRTANLESTTPDLLYSFDVKGPSPGVKGHGVELEKLVEMAEKKWEGKMIDKIVEGEYEVLDGEGENIMLTKKGKKITKLKSRPQRVKGSSEVIDEDEGFELI